MLKIDSTILFLKRISHLPSIRCLILCLAVFFFGKAYADSDLQPWPSIHGDVRNSDYTAQNSSQYMKPTWYALPGKPVASAITIDSNGHLYAITMDKGPCHLHALDREGKLIWCSKEVRTAWTAATVINDNSVLVNDGTEIFRFRSNGEIIWRVPSPGRSLGLVLLDNNNFAIADIYGVVSLFRIANGKKLASLTLPAIATPRPEKLPSAQALFQRGGASIGMDPNFIDFFIDAWSNYGVVMGNDVPAVATKHGLIFVVIPIKEGQGLLLGIDYKSSTTENEPFMKIRCQSNLQAGKSSPAISKDESRLYVGDGAGALVSFDIKTCKRRWSFEVGKASLASPTIGEDGIIILQAGNRLLAIKENGQLGTLLWETKLVEESKKKGYSFGSFNSVVLRSRNYIYVTASFYQVGKNKNQQATAIPVAHALLTIDPKTGAILASAPLGEESVSVLSMDSKGTIYVPSKPIIKGILLGSGLQNIPAPKAGVYAFRPD